MRTLHADLTAKQQSVSYTPYLELVFKSSDGVTTRTYITTDATNRIFQVQAAEGDYGGYVRLDTGGEWAAVIRLWDYDNSLGALNFLGYSVAIRFGFNTVSDNRYSEGANYFVRIQRRISVAGRIVLELLCVSLWEKLNSSWLNTSGTVAPVSYANTSVRHILMDMLGGVNPDAVLQYDQSLGSYLDITVEALNNIANDANLLPAIPAVGDRLLVGLATKFNRVSIDLTTPGSGLTIQAKYLSTAPSTFTNCDNITDGTNSLTTGQLKIVAFDVPGSAVTGSISGLGPYYWIALEVTAVAAPTQPKATRLTVGHFNAVALDSADANQGDDEQPLYISDYRKTLTDMVREILEFTLLGIICKSDGMHLQFIDNAQAVADYTYDSTHVVYQDLAETSLILPNKVVFVDREPGSGSEVYNSALDTDSVAALGTVAAIIIEPSITDATHAGVLATRMIARLNRNRAQGHAFASMNVGQEVWDLVSIEDARLDTIFSGRVTHIIRVYSAGVYYIDLEMGNYSGVVGSYTELMQLLEFNRRRIAERENVRTGVGPFIRNPELEPGLIRPLQTAPLPILTQPLRSRVNQPNPIIAQLTDIITRSPAPAIQRGPGFIEAALRVSANPPPDTRQSDTRQAAMLLRVQERLAQAREQARAELIRREDITSGAARIRQLREQVSNIPRIPGQTRIPPRPDEQQFRVR